jgi:hypothetical protein
MKGIDRGDGQGQAESDSRAHEKRIPPGALIARQLMAGNPMPPATRLYHTKPGCGQAA